MSGECLTPNLMVLEVIGGGGIMLRSISFNKSTNRLVYCPIGGKQMIFCT